MRILLLAVFTLSGFSGLIYESIWSHYLKLFLGHAAYAQSLVLVIFMGGMAFGAWLAGRYSARCRNLLLAYAVIEGLIGVLGLLFHGVFTHFVDLAYTQVFPALTSTVAIQAFKWGSASLLILPQSVLLGMTFPAMSAGLIRRYPDNPGASLALLYFVNSLGAAVGVLTSGFVLIAVVGLPGTILTAALLNVLLARDRRYVNVRTNGKSDAAVNLTPGAPPSDDEPALILAGIVPLALHPGPRYAAVIGIGSGLTTQALLDAPGSSKWTLSKLNRL